MDTPLDIALEPVADLLRQLLHLALIALAIYAVVCGAMYFAQSRLLFLPDLPSRELAVTPADIGAPYEDVRISTDDGETLHAWYVGSPEARFTVLFFHGNAGNISHRLDTLAIYVRLGLNVLLVDYRGYGESTGTPSERGTYLDAAAAWRYLVETRGVASERIVVAGRSLGGAVAVALAADVDPGALVIESTFSSIPDLASELYPLLPARWLARISYHSETRIGAVNCPILILHSRDDEIIPWHHGERLHAAAAGTSTLVALRGGHNEGFMMSKNYVPSLRQFVASLLVP